MLLLLAVMTASAEKWYMQVQVQVPGLTVSSDSLQSLLVVNNTPQVDDSLDFYCLMRTAEVLEQNGTFPSVSVYNRSMSQSSNPADLTRLTAEQVQQLRRNYQADALLVLNRLLFVQDENRTCSVSNWTLYQKTDGWRGHNVTMTDTLYATLSHRATPLESALQTGELACRRFFVHSELQDRYLFTSKNEDLAAGFFFFRKQDWGHAAAAFQRAMTNRHAQTRAMALADLAVSEELLGNRSDAREAAQQALDEFLRSQSPTSLEGAQIMRWYLSKLTNNK